MARVELGLRIGIGLSCPWWARWAPGSYVLYAWAADRVFVLVPRLSLGQLHGKGFVHLFIPKMLDQQCDSLT